VRWEPRDLPENNVSETHPLVELGTLLGGILLVTVLLTATLTLGAEIGLRYVPPDVEARLLGGLWDGIGEHGTEAEEQAPDPRHAPTQELLQRLAGHWKANPYELRVGIIEEEVSNAFALPGGAVLVTTGLLDSMHSENALAFVLAHEVGHFAGRDHLRGLSRGVAVSIVVALFTGGALGENLPALAIQMAQLGTARDAERDADRFALELVKREYGHIHGADEFFESLPDADAEGAGAELAGWVGSHPVTSERLEALDGWARQRGVRRVGQLTPLHPVFAESAEQAGPAQDEPATAL
jgi:Zn-dependent protease with chaperone function